MPDATSEAWRAIIIVTIAFATLSATLVAFVVLSRRKFVTIRREKLDSLRESELRFRSLIERSFDAIILCDSQLNITYASPSTLNIVGSSPEDFMGHHAEELFGMEFCHGIQNLMKADSLDLERTTLIQTPLIHHDGSLRWIECRATNMLHESGIKAIVINYRDITERKLSDERLEKSKEDLRALSTHLQSIREEERTSIAREIHDELGQLLTVLKMDLLLMEKSLEKKLHSEILSGAHADIEKMMDLIDDIIRSIRRIATELRPQILDELGLKDAIEWEAETFEARTGIQTVLKVDPEDINLDRGKNTALFRVFQEALTNVARHSKATSLTVSLSAADGLFRMTIADNGNGASAEELNNRSSLGILGMRERLMSVGGELNIRSTPGGGTVVTVMVSLGNQSQLSTQPSNPTGIVNVN